jgi:hypothetical protein
MLTKTSGQTPFLSIYLNDHRAGAAAGLALARRSAAHATDAAARRVLDEVATEIGRDRDTLEQIVDRLQVRRNPMKAAMATVGERIGRLKLNGRLIRRSELSDLIELEALLAGIDAKRSLWAALEQTHDELLHDIDFGSLIERATQQRGQLMPLHQSAASRALASGRR